MSYYEIKHGLDAIAEAIKAHGDDVRKAAEIKAAADVQVARINQGLSA